MFNDGAVSINPQCPLVSRSVASLLLSAAANVRELQKLALVVSINPQCPSVSRSTDSWSRLQPQMCKLQKLSRCFYESKTLVRKSFQRQLLATPAANVKNYKCWQGCAYKFTMPARKSVRIQLALVCSRKC